MESITLFGDYKVLDRQFLASSGSFKIVRYWIEGWHGELAQYGHIHFIFGLSGGKETELTRDEIYPIITFEVRQACPDNSTKESCEN
jgi:hypothetical protein